MRSAIWLASRHSANPAKATVSTPPAARATSTASRVLPQPPGPVKRDQPLRRQRLVHPALLGLPAEEDTRERGQAAHRRLARRRHRRQRRSGFAGVRKRPRQAAVAAARLCRIEQRAQAQSLVLDPVVVEPGQQVASIGLHRMRQLAVAEMPFEALHVAVEGVGVHADREPIGDEHRARGLTRRLEQPTQCRECLAQAIATGLRVDARPQQLDQLFPRMAAARIEREPREEQRHRPTRKARQHGVLARRLQPPSSCTCQTAEAVAKRLGCM